ncbi:MAG: F0F1 ATP synthase subunit B [Gemmatimonadota bacterium]
MSEPARGPALPAALAAGSATVLPAALDAQEGGSAIFSPDLGLAIWTLILFLLTLAVLAKWVFPMIAGGLEERRARIEGAIEEAREEREEARRLLERQKEQLAEARREAQDIIEEGRKAGEHLREEILEEAREEQEKMLARARKDLEREREQLMDEVRREAVDVAMKAAERLMRTRLDRERDREIVREYVSEIG